MELLKEAGAEAKKLLSYLEDLFRTHPTADELHVTADKQFFLDKSQADNYALKLRDKDVSTITRGDFEAVQANAQPEEATGTSSDEATPETATTPDTATGDDQIGLTENDTPAQADGSTGPAAEQPSGADGSQIDSDNQSIATDKKKETEDGAKS